jgi:hypothetical protein
VNIDGRKHRRAREFLSSGNLQHRYRHREVADFLDLHYGKASPWQTVINTRKKTGETLLEFSVTRVSEI